MRQTQTENDSQLSKSSPIPTKGRDGHEVKAGDIFLVQTFNQKTRRLPVHVQVYRNSFEHYAVMSKNKICPRCMFLNLRNSFLLHNDNADTEIKIVSNDLEGTSLILDIANEDDVSSWVDALQSDCPPSSPKQISSPLLSSSSIAKSSNLQTLIEAEEE